MRLPVKPIATVISFFTSECFVNVLIKVRDITRVCERDNDFNKIINEF